MPWTAISPSASTCRDARNGRAFIAEAERICKTKITILSGKREAHLTALGIVSGIYKPDGIVGDLGGGSLELVDVHAAKLAFVVAREAAARGERVGIAIGSEQPVP